MDTPSRYRRCAAEAASRRLGSIPRCKARERPPKPNPKHDSQAPQPRLVTAPSSGNDHRWRGADRLRPAKTHSGQQLSGGPASDAALAASPGRPGRAGAAHGLGRELTGGRGGKRDGSRGGGRGGGGWRRRGSRPGAAVGGGLHRLRGGGAAAGPLTPYLRRYDRGLEPSISTQFARDACNERGIGTCSAASREREGAGRSQEEEEVGEGSYWVVYRVVQSRTPLCSCGWHGTSVYLALWWAQAFQKARAWRPCAHRQPRCHHPPLQPPTAGRPPLPAPRLPATAPHTLPSAGQAGTGLPAEADLRKEQG